MYIVVDIGASKIRIGLATFEKVVEKIVLQTPRVGDEYTIANLIIDKIVEKYGSYIDRVRAISIATIGPLDIRKGAVVNTTNLPIKNFELLEPIKSFFKKPVYVVNDAVASVYGEKQFGSLLDYSNIVYITMSTGIGGGVIVDNHLLIGKMGNAHEVGHIVVKYDDGLPCGCGGRGHWESYAGGANIPKLAQYLASKTKYSSEAYFKAIKNELSPPDLFQYYRFGDYFAKSVVDEIIRVSIAGLATVTNLYDPEIIVIGGPVFLNNIDILYKPLVDGLNEEVVTEKPVVKPSVLRDDAGLYGALAVAINPPEELLKIQPIYP